jgi:hypothetical protein
MTKTVCTTPVGVVVAEAGASAGRQGSFGSQGGGRLLVAGVVISDGRRGARYKIGESHNTVRFGWTYKI